MGVERGVPASTAMRDQLTTKLDDVSKAMVEYIAAITPNVGALPINPPQGAGELAFVLTRVSQEVAFGRITPEEGGERMVSEAKNTLARK